MEDQIRQLMAEIVERAKKSDLLQTRYGNNKRGLEAALRKDNRLFEVFYPDLFFEFGDLEMNYHPKTGRWNLDIGSLDIMKDNPHAQQWFAEKYPGKVWDLLKEDTRKLMAMSYAEEFLKITPPGTVVNVKGAHISAVRDVQSGAKNIPKVKRGRSIGQRKQDIYEKRFLRNPDFTKEGGVLVYRSGTGAAQRGLGIDQKPRSIGAAGFGAELAPSTGAGWDAHRVARVGRRAASVLPVVGAGFDAWDIADRTNTINQKLASDSDYEGSMEHRLDLLQRGISGATLGTTFWAEPANMALGLTNLGIDASRWIGSKFNPEEETRDNPVYRGLGYASHALF